ncbi:MAG: helix-turn-helix domain-containing protein [Polyangiaceae bacterium]
MLIEGLAAELERRRSNNPRYSLRAFARDLGMHHASLSRLLRGRLRPSPKLLQSLDARLTLCPTALELGRVEAHDSKVLAVMRRADFVANSRFVATRAGLSLDAVNASLFRLLRAGRLSMRGPDWKIHE